MIDAEIGATGEVRAKGHLKDLGRKRKKRSPSPGFKKSFKKVWVNIQNLKILFTPLNV